jgi:hypothetical protein
MFESCRERQFAIQNGIANPNAALTSLLAVVSAFSSNADLVQTEFRSPSVMPVVGRTYEHVRHSIEWGSPAMTGAANLNALFRLQNANWL